MAVDTVDPRAVDTVVLPGADTVDPQVVVRHRLRSADPPDVRPTDHAPEHGRQPVRDRARARRPGPEHGRRPDRGPVRARRSNHVPEHGLQSNRERDRDSYLPLAPVSVTVPAVDVPARFPDSANDPVPARDSCLPAVPASAIGRVPAIGRTGQASETAKIAFRIDLPTGVIESGIAVVVGTTGTTAIITTMITGTTAIGTAIGDRVRMGGTGGTDTPP